MKVFFLFVAIVLPMALLAQKKDHTLLWKISGNGLSKPSFLFGTIHLQDRRVFNFTDSLYYYLENVDGFAMEVHPDSIAQVILNRVDNELSSDLLKDKLSKDEFEKIDKQLKKQLGIGADKLSVRDAYFINERLHAPKPKPDDMQTFVDLYLYGLAVQHDKTIFGLEKLEDQLALFDELGSDFSPRELLKSKGPATTPVDRVIEMYAAEDTAGIMKLVRQMPGAVEEKMLTKRNQLMVQKIDSIIRNKSFFVAVGFAHLPGVKGLLHLLQQKGYSVDPVYSQTRVHASNYKLKSNDGKWINITDTAEGYSVQLPGKPTAMDMLSGAMKMQMFYDLLNMKVYYSAHVVSTVTATAKNVDSLMEEMVQNSMQRSASTMLSSHPIKRTDCFGKEAEFYLAKERMTLRMEILIKSRDVYLLVAGAKDSAALHNADSEKFFNSFVFLAEKPKVRWAEFHSEEDAFSVICPGKPKIKENAQQESSKAIEYNLPDPATGNYYSVVVSRMSPLYTIGNDTTYLTNVAKGLQKQWKVHKGGIHDTVVSGFPAKWVETNVKGMMARCLSINRLSRGYSLIAVTEISDTSFRQFFNAFRLLPYVASSTTREASPQNDFTAIVPSPILQQPADTSDDTETRRTVHYAFDQHSRQTFIIIRDTLNALQWKTNDTALMKALMKKEIGDRDELVFYRLLQAEHLPAIDFTSHRKGGYQEQHVRLILNGNVIYKLQLDDTPKVNSPPAGQCFFSDFHITKTGAAPLLQNESQFLQALNSTDSLTFSRAFNAIDELVFPEEEFETLLNASLRKYPLDTTYYQTAGSRLRGRLTGAVNATALPVISKIYRSISGDAEEYKYPLLELMTTKPTVDAIDSAVRLYDFSVPHAGEPYSFVANLSRNLQATAKLAPVLLKHISDTLGATSFFSLYNELLDSNYLHVADFNGTAPAIIGLANQELKKMQQDPEYYDYGVNYLMKVLVRVQPDSALRTLYAFTHAKITSAQVTSALLLLKDGHSVDPDILGAIAADRYYRTYLYDTLTGIGKETLYPRKYRSQQSFAESYIYNSTDEYTVEKMQYVGTRTLPFRGTKGRFYLFKVTLDEDDDSKTYLGVAGPFSMDAKKVSLDLDYSGFYGDEIFSPSKVDAYLKAYLQNFEKPDVVEDVEVE